MDVKRIFRKLPKMDNLLKDEKIQKMCEDHGKGFVMDCIRHELDHVRAIILTGDEAAAEARLAGFMNYVEEKVNEESRYPLRKVCNATGIILHTNLGRAPLGKIHRDAVMQVMDTYSNLEFDLKTGKRGKRWKHYGDLVSKVVGSEAAIAVNNNAASLTLIFGALARGKEIVVSRGESIEVGGQFRIPEVIEESGATLREVGTTNRTRISDYEKAINENTGALLKVHTSNYKIIGFTEEASLEELVELGKKYNIPVIMDSGSGVLVNLEKYGLAHEPTVQEQLKAGADIVCFSGDKLLGGPQAGVIVGKKEMIEKIENYPLMRAIRMDKCGIAALSATFREYQDEKRAEKNIPVLHMIARPLEELKNQAEQVYGQLTQYGHLADFAVEESLSMVGGGSLPEETFGSFAVTIHPKNMTCEMFADKLRSFPIPIIAHMKNDKVWLDMRTIMPEEVELVVKSLKTFYER